MPQIKDPENTLILTTSKGTATIALRPDLAPNHVSLALPSPSAHTRTGFPVYSKGRLPTDGKPEETAASGRLALC